MVNYIYSLSIYSHFGAYLSQTNQLLANLPQLACLLRVTCLFRKLVFEWFRVLVPTPVNTWFCKTRITHNLQQERLVWFICNYVSKYFTTVHVSMEWHVLIDLCKSAPSFFFRNIAFGNILLKWWEEKTEQWNVFPKQTCCCNATGVKGGKGDSGFLVVPPVELLHGEHITNFAVFICLGTIKISSIYHSWTLYSIQACCKTSKVPEVSFRWHIPGQCVCVSWNCIESKITIYLFAKYINSEMYLELQ